MLIQCGGPDLAEISLAEQQKQEMLQQAGSMNLDTVLAGLDILTTTKNRMRGTSHPQILLELAVVRLARLDELTPLTQLTQLLTQPGISLPKAPISGGEVSKKNLTASPSVLNNGTEVAHISVQPLPSNPSPPRSFEENWRQTLTELSGILASHLEKAGLPAISGPKSLVIRFGARYSAAYDYCSDSKNLARIEESLRKISGETWVVRVEKESQPSGPTPASETAAPTSRKDREKAILQQPVFQRITDLLQARMLTMDDGFGTVASKPNEDESPPTDTEEE
jgi:DNA polymerase-3 subunit gamma/tau